MPDAPSPGAMGFTGSDGPALHNLMLFDVNDDNLAFVFEIIIDASGCRIGLRKLRFASERHGCDDLCRLQVNHRRRLAASVEQIDLLLTRLIKHSIGVLARSHL